MNTDSNAAAIAAEEDRREALAENPDLEFCPENCPACGSEDLHSASIGGEEAVSCCDCVWAMTYAELRAALNPPAGEEPT